MRDYQCPQQKVPKMKVTTILKISVGSLFLIYLTAAMSAPSGDQICKKMIADGRGGGQSQSECMCVYRVADAVLDADIKGLLFDSWNNGTNNIQAIGRLPKQGRVRKQLRTMQRSLKANCG